jgi:hypothetical protein
LPFRVLVEAADADVADALTVQGASKGKCVRKKSMTVKRLIGRQGHENGLQIAIERSPMLALGLALVVAFEG